MRHTKRRPKTPREEREESKQISVKKEEMLKIEEKTEENIQTKQEDIMTKKEESVLDNDPSKEEDNQLHHKQANSKLKKRIANSSEANSSNDEQFNEEKNNFRSKKSEKGATSAKNIIKNYGRALQNFAVSNMVLPYITPLLNKEDVSLKEFRAYYIPKKKEVRSIAGLRSLLLICGVDGLKVASFKRIFRELSIIFIKFFSVNWIYSGKLLNKAAHLKCRFKMLRRIKDPENFTYLKEFM